MTNIVAALALLLGATSAGLAQSQSGGNFGTPYSGTAAARSGGHSYYHARYRSSGGQSANGGARAGGEVDASDSNSSLAAAARARR